MIKLYSRVPVVSDCRKGAMALFLLWGTASFFISSNIIGAKLFLIYIYGLEKVRQQNLHFLRMGKGTPWLVSNGDLISSHIFIHFLISMARWFVLFVPTYLLVRMFLPKIERRA